MELYSLQQQPYYDSFTQSYRQIITINKMPEGPLKKRVKRVHNPQLSPFQFPPPQNCPPPNCIFAIYGDCGQLMCVDQLPEFFNYLIQNNYIFDYQLTKMMEKSKVQSSNTLLCYIKYEKN